MLEMLMQSKAGASLAGNLGKSIGDAIGGGGPMTSGGTVDARGFLDGSGWTVSTGSSRATGGSRTGGPQMGGGPALPQGWGGAQPMQAGMNPLLMLALLGGVVWAALKK